MKRSFACFVLILSGTLTQSAPPDVPKEVVGEKNKPVFFDVKATNKKFAFAPGFDKTKCPIVKLATEDDSPDVVQFMAFPAEDGEFYVTFWTTGEKKYSQTVLRIGKGKPVPPGPLPPVPPVPPDPDGQTYTAPVWIFIVEETSKRTSDYVLFLQDIAYWNDLEKKGYKMRPYDIDSADAKRMKLDSIKDSQGNKPALPFLVFADSAGKVIKVSAVPTDTKQLTPLLPKVKLPQSIDVTPAPAPTPVPVPLQPTIIYPSSYAVPGVAAPVQPFRSLQHDSHSCPNCGHSSRATHIQLGSGPLPGTHWHSCPVCSARWWH